MQIVELPIGEVEIVFHDLDRNLTEITLDICLTDDWCFGHESIVINNYKGYSILNITSSFRKLATTLKSFALEDSAGQITIRINSTIIDRQNNDYQVIVHSMPKYKYISIENEKSSRRKRSIYEDENLHAELCTIHPWTLNFEDIGWDGWIIQPKYFEANLCRGSCLLDEDTEKNMSSHSFLREIFRQSITDEHQLQLIPPATCVPINMYPMNILYNKSGNLQVKRMAEMIAGDCGCA